jgi:hypothetical protein
LRFFILALSARNATFLFTHSSEFFTKWPREDLLAFSIKFNENKKLDMAGGYGAILA